MSAVPVFSGEWDDEGVYVYQAFRDSIAGTVHPIHQSLNVTDIFI